MYYFLVMKSVPPLGDLLRGTPDVILQPPRAGSVLIAWLHANEELAPRLMHHVLTHRPDLAPFVSFVCGNPHIAATDPAKGFGDTDLNRSFNPPHHPQSYEEKRAPYIVELAKQYDYVLDLHNTVGDSGDFIITTEDMVNAPTIGKLIAAARNTQVVVMPEAVSKHSLIGAVANAIVLEYFVGHIEKGIGDAEHLIESLVTNRTSAPFAREFFFVTGTIPKTADPGLDVQNFTFVDDDQGGYYPLFLGTGPRSYREDPTKDYCCLAARRRDVRVL